MSKFSPETGVENLSTEFLEASAEFIDWSETSMEQLKVYAAEVCEECGNVCVMSYLGENDHREWSRNLDEKDDEEEFDGPTDTYELPLVVEANVQAYLGFSYRVIGDEAVPLGEEDSEESPEILMDAPGVVDEIDGDDVYVRFEGVEPRFKLSVREHYDLVEIIEDETYEGIRPDKKPGDCTYTLYNEGPMMNFRYSVDVRRVGGPEEAAKAIYSLPLCIVDLNHGGYYLALTGGGMDLTWEIAEAYMRLGYLPPTFCHDLPRYWGKTNPVDRWIVEGCIRGVNVLFGWQEDRRERLLKHLAEMPVKEENNA